MDRIRVLQIITRLVRRGASRHVVNLARGLDSSRFDVEILAGRAEPGEGSLWSEAEATGLKLHNVESLRRPIRPLADVAAYRAIRKVIEDGQFDVVHTHISKSGILGRLAARQVRVPLVVHTYHGAVSELVRPGMLAPVLLRVERRCADMTDICIAVSQRVAEQLADSGITGVSGCTVIPNGIDLNYYRLDKAGPRPTELRVDARVLGMVGSLTEEKGIERLLVAAKRLIGTYPALQVCIVGDGPLRGKLESRANELGIADRVLFMGVVEDVRPWMAAFDVLAMPSISEGMPLTLVEALSLECPIVATDVGGVREAVGDAAVLVSGSVDDLTDALSGALQTGRGGLPDSTRRAQAEKFALPLMTARTAQVYESATSAMAGLVPGAESPVQDASVRNRLRD